MNEMLKEILCVPHQNPDLLFESQKDTTDTALSPFISTIEFYIEKYFLLATGSRNSAIPCTLHQVTRTLIIQSLRELNCNGWSIMLGKGSSFS